MSNKTENKKTEAAVNTEKKGAEKAAEKQEEPKLNAAKLKAVMGQKLSDYCESVGLKPQHTEHNTPKAITKAVEEHMKQAQQIERSQGYHDVAVEKLPKTPEYKAGSRAQHEYDRDSNLLRIEMAQKKQEQAAAVIEGKEPIDLRSEVVRNKIALRECQVILACKRPDHSGTKKMNLGNFEKERLKAVEAGHITGKEFPKFAEENENGEWVPAAGRMKQNAPVENKLKEEVEGSKKEQEPEAEEAKA